MTGIKSAEWKGYVYAITGTIAFSSLYVFSKAGLNQVELSQFGLYYFGISFLLNLLLLFFSGEHKRIWKLPVNVLWLLLMLAALDLGSNITFFLAIRAIANPSVTSFLGNLFPVFLTSLGIIFLKERFTIFEALGGLLAISGAFVISYSGELDWQKFFIPGTGFVLMNTLLAAVFSVIVKKNIQKTSPVIFNLNSNFWIFLAFLCYFLWQRQTPNLPVSAFRNIALSAFFGSFIGLLCFYNSYRYITASKSSIIQSLKGIFVLIFAYLFFGNFPLAVQLWGGAGTISGVMLMTFAQAGLIGKKNKPELA